MVDVTNGYIKTGMTKGTATLVEKGVFGNKKETTISLSSVGLDAVKMSRWFAGRHFDESEKDRNMDPEENIIKAIKETPLDKFHCFMGTFNDSKAVMYAEAIHKKQQIEKCMMKEKDAPDNSVSFYLLGNYMPIGIDPVFLDMLIYRVPATMSIPSSSADRFIIGWVYLALRVNLWFGYPSPKDLAKNVAIMTFMQGSYVAIQAANKIALKEQNKTSYIKPFENDIPEDYVSTGDKDDILIKEKEEI